MFVEVSLSSSLWTVRSLIVALVCALGREPTLHNQSAQLNERIHPVLHPWAVHPSWLPATQHSTITIAILADEEGSALSYGYHLSILYLQDDTY